MQSKHAFLIMAHADIHLLKVLVGMLDDARNDIYIHIDKKWKDFDTTQLSVAKSRLIVLPERIDGRWGHSSLMHIEYALFHAAYAQGPYSYYHLLSGADLPIKTQDYIHQFFDKQPPTPYISYWKHSGDVYYKVSRYAFFMEYERMAPKYRHIARVIAFARRMIADIGFRIFGERPNSKLFTKGANWCSLSHDALALLFGREAEMKRRLAYTRSGEEIFAQTILEQDYFTPQGIDPYQIKDLRFVNWKSSAQSPDVFTIEDWLAIQQSSDLFARKFSSSVDPEIIKLVQAHYGA